MTRAVGLVFAADSFLFGSWVARIPFIKYQLGLNDAQLGLALFAMPIGSILMNPFTGRIIRAIGSANASLLGGILFFLSVLLPIHAGTLGVLTAGLFFMGIFTALLNVAMNTAVTNIEREQNIRIMSTCHGMWSLGGMFGSALAGLLIWANIPANYHMIGVAIFLVSSLLLLKDQLTSIPEIRQADGSSLAKPTPELLILIFIGITISVGEGLAFDWSAIYLREVSHATASVSALGFAFFAFAMTLGRFIGDSFIPHIGEKRLLLFGGILGALGLSLAVLIPAPSIVLLGFLLLGFGCSLGAPILYAASMRLPHTAPAAGLATYATFSFVGFMAGPPMVGFVAEAFGLSYGLVLVGLLLVLGSVVSRWARL
ncbi:MFS transporter [Arundinibacter roseus]|nr:MFS transporter [Arundinibacter roseus]